MKNNLNNLKVLSDSRIEKDGYWYEYVLGLGLHRQSICLATREPNRYCNGLYLYSSKDPGSGKCYIVVDTNNPEYIDKI
jgi:hypothetical protein